MIYIIKQEGLYQNKVNSSLVFTCNCKMGYWSLLLQSTVNVNRSMWHVSGFTLFIFPRAVVIFKQWRPRRTAEWKVSAWDFVTRCSKLRRF